MGFFRNLVGAMQVKIYDFDVAFAFRFLLSL